MRKLLHLQRLLQVRKMSVDVGGMRIAYRNDSFDVGDLHPTLDPFEQFRAWFNEAVKTDEIKEANAMCLATSDIKTGRPSARMVLLKEFGKDPGFVFYTNRDSRKGQELADNPYAALMFYWEPLKRSVRIEGKTEKVSDAKSAEYFDSRPIGSKIGAAVSVRQSEVVACREVLTQREMELKEKGEAVQKPPYWGGYRVVPDCFEFWQGQTTRIHDRLRFRRPEHGEEIDSKIAKVGTDGWIIERLSP